MSEQDNKKQAEQIVDKIKELVEKGNVSRIYLKRKGETLLNLSLNVGIIGAVIGLSAAPFVVLTTALVSFGFDCEIEIEKTDGTIINLNNTEIGSKLEKAKAEVKDKAKDIFSSQETKVEEVVVDETETVDDADITVENE